MRCAEKNKMLYLADLIGRRNSSSSFWRSLLYCQGSCFVGCISMLHDRLVGRFAILLDIRRRHGFILSLLR